MPRKPARLQPDTLNDIRATAFTLFGQSGYDGVAIRDIARLARVSKGALYWHFRGKDELYLDCLQVLHAIFQQHVFDRMLAEPDALRRVVALFQGLEQLLQDPRIEHGVAGYWLGAGNTRLRAIDEAQRLFEQRTSAIIRDALQLAMEQELMDVGTDLDDLSRSIIAIMEAIVLPLRNQTRDEVHRMLGVLARALFRAYARNERLVALADQILAPAARRAYVPARGPD
jgi:AcrR family transcriptional regulator